MRLVPETSESVSDTATGFTSVVFISSSLSPSSSSSYLLHQHFHHQCHNRHRKLQSAMIPGKITRLCNLLWNINVNLNLAYLYVKTFNLIWWVEVTSNYEQDSVRYNRNDQEHHLKDVSSTVGLCWPHLWEPTIRPCLWLQYFGEVIMLLMLLLLTMMLMMLVQIDDNDGYFS